MKKNVLLILLFFSSLLFSQTLIQTVNIPAGTIYSNAYGFVYANGKYWITSSSSSAAKKIYGLNASGVQTDEITINYYTMKESQGLAFDGSNFWYVERKTSKCDLYKVSPDGTVLDSVIISSVPGGGSWYLGGAAWDGSSVWISVYYPNTNAALFKIDPVTKQFTDTIYMPAGQLQPTGVTVKGDTIFVVNDGFEGTDKIYAFSISTDQLIYSFNPPERPGQRQNPRGLAWDGQYFWLMAEPIGASSGRQLFKYDLAGNGTPGIYVLNSTLNFGNVQIDSSYTLFSSINNYGTADLVISSAVSSNGAFQVLNPMPFTIHPDSTNQLMVKFTPTANVSYVDSIRLYHNFAAIPYNKITVSGSGVYSSSYISFSLGSLNYGDRRVNSLCALDLTIRNLGSQLLTVDSVKLNTGIYTIDGFTAPAVIDTANPRTFRVWFHPGAIQSFDDILTVYSNAGNGHVKTLPVSGNGISFNPVIGNILWQGVIPDNPMTSADDLSVKVLKKIQDINGDGIEDVIATTDNYWVIAYNGNSSVTSDILWKFNTYISSSNAGSVELVQNLQFADLNSDGMEDVIIGTWGGNESVYALNGKTGQEMWEFGLPATYDDGDIMGVDAKRDFNNDGVHDILVSASGNETSGSGRFSVYLLNGINGQQIWRIDQSSQQKLKYDVTSLTNGGAFGTRVGTSYEVVGFNPQGQITWSYPAATTPWRLGEIQDLNNDGNTDVIAGNFGAGPVVAIGSDAGIPLWTRNIGNVYVEDFRVIKDVTSNGVQDIIISGIAPALFLLEGSNGNIIWNQGVSGNILGIGDLPDMTGDGLPEVGVGDLSNNLTIFNITNGNPIFTYSFGSGSNYAAEMISALGEIDGTGAGDFVAGSRGGIIIAFSGGSAGIIPVQLTSVTASVNNNEVTVNWTAATQLNNKGFNIERKSEGSQFENVGFVKGDGTSSEPVSYTFTDKEVPFGSYYYRLAQIDFDGTVSYSKEVKVEVNPPAAFALEQNYPNPFNPSTVIKYSIPVEGSVSLKIYNTIGEEVAVLFSGIQKPGNYKTEWNGKNSMGMNVPSGVYIYRIESGNFVNTKKMMMIK